MRCGPDCRYGSAYPPSLSVKADLLAWQPSANCGLMHCSKIYTPPSFETAHAKHASSSA
jgi:hypothetical protein